MDIRQLKYLSAVVNYGDYQLAARSLFISPQGLSKAIRQLENELGLALMEKVGRESRPTNAAIELVARSPQLISEYDLLLRFLCEGDKHNDLCSLEKLTLGVYKPVKCYEHLTGFSSAEARGGFPLAVTLCMECTAPLACHDAKGAARHPLRG